MSRVAIVVVLLALSAASAWGCDGLGECAVERASAPDPESSRRIGATIEIDSSPFGLAPHGHAVLVNAAVPLALPREVEMRLWLRYGATSVGAGLASAYQPLAGASMAWRPGLTGTGELVPRDMMIGVRYALGDVSRVFADHVTSMPAAASLQPAGADRSVRVGLEFKSAKNPALAGLPGGTLLRVQLSRDANLALRPRHGGMALTLRTQW